ncbi:hypothetical protein [Halopiger djelfimassiliensis]|uniref:hypothetical protein n=1 Tax=Halopiger djelfimassiliensis TaxID=1293047 RepID=UPI000677A154|nr:hypothetical protein [Halopiger djelfimassiliensis]
MGNVPDDIAETVIEATNEWTEQFEEAGIKQPQEDLYVIDIVDVGERDDQLAIDLDGDEIVRIPDGWRAEWDNPSDLSLAPEAELEYRDSEPEGHLVMVAEQQVAFIRLDFVCNLGAE